MISTRNFIDSKLKNIENNRIMFLAKNFQVGRLIYEAKKIFNDVTYPSSFKRYFIRLLSALSNLIIFEIFKLDKAKDMRKKQKNN